MKNKIYHTVGTVPKSTRKIVPRGKIDTPNTHTDVIVLFVCFGEGYSIKCGGVIIACNFSSIYEYICNIFQYQFF